MTLKLSAQEISRTYTDCPCLSDLIQAIEVDVQKLGRVVCKVKVNGLALSESDEARLAATSVSDVTEIEVETEAVNDLVQSSVETMNRMVVCLRDEAVRLADVYRSGATPDARARFMNIIKNTQVLTDGLVVLKPIFAGTIGNSGSIDNEWRANEEHMVKAMRELVEAFESEDWVLLSDVLEYELYNSLDKWRSLLCQLISPRNPALEKQELKIQI